jgi:hypothetical protein
LIQGLAGSKLVSPFLLSTIDASGPP